MIIDIIFLTNLYQRKRPLSTGKYWLMVGIMTVVTIIEIFLLRNNNRIIIQSLITSLIVYLFYDKDLKAIAYCSFSFALMSIFEVFLLSTIRLSYNLLIPLIFALKLFSIAIIFRELNIINIDMDFKGITTKILYIIFSFLCLCGAIYINMNWRC